MNTDDTVVYIEVNGIHEDKVETKVDVLPVQDFLYNIILGKLDDLNNINVVFSVNGSLAFNEEGLLYLVVKRNGII